MNLHLHTKLTTRPKIRNSIQAFNHRDRSPTSIPGITVDTMRTWGVNLLVFFSSVLGVSAWPLAVGATDQHAEVDCALPSQIRTYGQDLTMLAPRRTVQTTAADCRERGGEARAVATAQTTEPAPKSLSAPELQGQVSVKQLQRALAGLGYEPGPVDGIFGRKTASAIAAFQRDTGLDINGRPSYALLRRLQERLAEHR